MKPASDCLFIDDTTDICQHRDLKGIVCTGQCDNFTPDGLDKLCVEE